MTNRQGFTLVEAIVAYMLLAILRPSCCRRPRSSPDA